LEIPNKPFANIEIVGQMLYNLVVRSD